jgi:hypothetical protein
VTRKVCAFKTKGVFAIKFGAVFLEGALFAAGSAAHALGHLDALDFEVVYLGEIVGT